ATALRSRSDSVARCRSPVRSPAWRCRDGVRRAWRKPRRAPDRTVGREGFPALRSWCKDRTSRAEAWGALLSERLGGGIAIGSKALGGAAAAVTRYLVGDADPLTLAILRWGIGVLCVLPIAVLLRARWPRRRDWPAVAALGLAFFGLFFILYNV